MNVLILSAGTRVKLIQYFKKAVGDRGRVVAADVSALAPAIYEADKYYIVPPISNPGYMESILSICREERIDGVLSLIDPELSLLAENQERLAEIGTIFIGSSYSLCEMSLDKMQMYQWLENHGYPCAKSWDKKEVFYEAVQQGMLSYPVFVKPARGSASINVSKVYDRKTVEFLFAHEDNLMIQAFLDGKEIGADVYVDMISGEVVSIFTKTKLRMRAGETDKSVSFKDPALFEIISRFVLEAGFRGQLDIDIFDVGGVYHICEVNPRFGGGYPHAHEAGCDHTKLILNNLQGIANPPRIGDYEENIYMMKYNELLIKKDLE